jgi:2-polyprenyl-3-methyl-5-hydroxy-6-metoxy-1,4-benzoquinol methylase
MSSIDIPVGAFAPSLGGSVASPLGRSAARLVPVRERFRRTLLALADQYPDSLQPDQRRDVSRHAFQIERIYRPGAVLADLGGGIGLFSPACATLGMETWLVDDLRDPVNERFPIDALGIHRRAGVNVLATPVLDFGRHFEDESLDVVTCFDSIEHWHHSPRPVLEQVWRVLRPGGLLFLGTPNAANARNRLTLLLGRSNWSHFEDWYYPAEFRGHVREPVLADLVRMIAELGFERRAVFGRNWVAAGGPAGVALAAVDRALRPFPTLCKDIYVLAAKPVSPSASVHERACQRAA